MFKKTKQPIQQAQEIVTEEENKVQVQANKTVQSGKTWQIQEVATQTTPVIVNTKTNETLNLYDAVAEILNILQEVREA